MSKSERPKAAKIKSIHHNKASRLIAVQCLYSYDASENSTQVVQDLVKDMLNNLDKYRDIGTTRFNREYLVVTLQNTIGSLKLLDDNIRECLQENWTLERLPKVVLATLRVAIAELLNKHLDRAIIINEYVDIVKILNHESDSGFVNSVLHNIAKKYDIK